jgi:tRNA(Ile)-lysidine synthase TilS/MesJ
MSDKKYSISISKSLNKRFKSPLLGKFLKAIDEYKLIEKGDKICVALSGGKDSLLLAALFEEYKLHYNNSIEVVYLTMNSGFTKAFLENHKSNLDLVGVKSEIEDSLAYEIANLKDPKSPCFLCARMRRGFLYQHAQELGCNKLALGHHFDDVIETTLMNMFYTGTFKTMLPKARSKNFEGLELIRPMYLIKEQNVERFMKYHDIKFVSKGCEFQDRNEDSKRNEMKVLIQQLRNTYENIDINIFRSAENINLDAVLGYYDNTKRTCFLDEY